MQTRKIQENDPATSLSSLKLAQVRNLIKTVHLKAEFNEAKSIYKTPSFVTKSGHSMRTCVEIAKGISTKK